MSGEKVIVRTCGNIPKLCRLVQPGSGVVYVTNEEQFSLLLSGDEKILMVGIPYEDVFLYDLKAERQMFLMANSQKFAWDELHGWADARQD